MKLLRKLLAITMASAMTMTVFAGMSFTASAAGSEPGKTFTLDETVATIHGRYTQEKHAGEDTYTFSHGAAGITVNFTGTEFWVKVPEVPTWANDEGVEVPHAGNLAVVVDSDMAMDATMVPVREAGWICLASGLSDGEHTIEVRKQSRGFYGFMASEWIGISQIGVSADGSILTPDPLSDLVIEVYGDSISNGDAVWLNEDGSNSSYTYGNWTGVIERLLDAEVRVTANTGNGLLGWVMCEKNGQLDNLLPPQNNWDKIDPNHGGGVWDHSGDNAADVVIINLGTNDRGELGNGDLTRKAFSEEYVRFIKQIKTDCPDAIVICTIGAMGGINEWGDTLGGAGVDYVEYEWNDGGYTRTIAEGDMIDNLLGAGIAVAGTAFDSGVSVYGGTAVAANVNDANKSTGWQPAENSAMGENCYVGIKFDDAVTSTGATITWEEGTRAVASTSGYRVEVTTDGTNWSVPAGIVYNYGTDTDTITFDEVDVMGIRVITLQSTNTKYASKIWELGVTSEEKADAVISEDDIQHIDSVIDICNEWAGETFCYFVEIQKCDTMEGGAGYDNGHPSNLAGEVYGLQYATLINKVLGLNKELPTDIPAYAYEKKLGKDAPEGNILEAITGKTTTLSYIDEVIARAQIPASDVKIGDVDNDGAVAASDLTVLARHVGGIETITDAKAVEAADTDKSGAIDASDLTKLARVVAQIDTDF